METIWSSRGTRTRPNRPDPTMWEPSQPLRIAPSCRQISLALGGPTGSIGCSLGSFLKGVSRRLSSLRMRRRARTIKTCDVVEIEVASWEHVSLAAARAPSKDYPVRARAVLLLYGGAFDSWD